MDLADILDVIWGDRIRVTDHADEKAHADGLRLHEIPHSAFQGEVIEDYPGDRPFPSCLVYGNTARGAPVLFSGFLPPRPVARPVRLAHRHGAWAHPSRCQSRRQGEPVGPFRYTAGACRGACSRR